MMAFIYWKLFSRYVGSGRGPETYGPSCEGRRRCDFMCSVDKPKRENQSLPQTQLSTTARHVATQNTDRGCNMTETIITSVH